MQKDTPEALKPFEFHGLEFSLNGTEAIADCPSCDGNNKLYISQETGRFQCKSCSWKGNKNTFLTFRHSQLTDSQKKSDYKHVRKLRDNVFPSSYLEDHGICLDDDGCVAFPIQTPGTKNLSNLRKWQPSNGVFYSTPTCCSLYFHQWEKEGPVMVVEGEWDAVALSVLMSRAKYTTQCSIVAAPGANTFKPVWKKWFKGRDVYLLYDNDHDKKNKQGTFNPAKDGMEKVSKLLNGTAKSIQAIDWSLVGKDLPDGYDVRDHLGQAIKKKKSKTYLRKLLQACKPLKTKSVSDDGNEAPVVNPLERTEFPQVVEDFRSKLEFNQTFEDVLACCFACLVTLHMSHQKRSPLWMFIVAPPSSGKTTIIEAFDAATEYTSQVSNLTPASLSAGISVENEEGNRVNNSLLNQIKNKVLFVKDFTPVLTMGGDRERVFGILRDSYDGSYIHHFATQTNTFHNLYFGIVAGVTHAIERISMSDLGERFLRIRLLDESFDELAHILSALDNVDEEDTADHKQFFQSSVLGFCQHLIANLYQPTYDREMNHRLAALSQFTAICRTEIPKGNSKDLSYRPVPEVASRIATELKKLGLGLAMVYGRKEVDEDCYRVMQKVAFDSCVGWKLEAVQHLDSSEYGLTRKTLAQKMQIHINQAGNILKDCQELGLVTTGRMSNNTGNRGNKSNAYVISPAIKKLMKTAEISFRHKPKNKTVSAKAKRSRRKTKRS